MPAASLLLALTLTAPATAPLPVAAIAPVAREAVTAPRDTLIAFSGTVVDLETGNANVRVRVGRDGEVRIVGYRDDDDADWSRLDVVRTGSVLRLRGSDLRRSRDDIELVVPRRTDLRLRTRNGDVVIDALDGDVFVETFAGDITVHGARLAELSTLSGDVLVERADRGASVRSTSGDVQLRGVREHVRVDGTSSTVTLRDVDAESVDIEVMSGDIVVDGTLVSGGRYAFKSHSGDVRLAIGDGTSAVLEVQTFNGDVLAEGMPLTLMPDVDADDRRLDQRRRELERARDSVRRIVRDSVRRERERLERERRDRGDSAIDERSLEQVITVAITDALAAVSRTFERDVAPALSAALSDVSRDLRSDTRARRFRIGDGSGPLVTVSTFNGDVVVTRRR